MSGEHVAWVLNLDADLELAAGKEYAPSKGVLGAMAQHVAKLARSLVGPDDVVLAGDTSRLGVGAAALRGRAFCPTPRAIALMRRHGVEPEVHPAFEVLRRVNGRGFCAELGQTLAGAVFVVSVEEAARTVAALPPIGRQWRAKRAYGMAGRGQRPIAPGALSGADRRFIAASIERDGGLQIEPEVAIVRELTVHGMLAADGTLRLGRVVEQRCDASGQWRESAPLDAEGPEDILVPSLGDLGDLGDEARRVASALHAAGYFGPFGVDAFEHRDGDRIVLNPRSEINARYSMGFPASGLLAGRASVAARAQDAPIAPPVQRP
ncbi:MAG: hypothetical protein KIT84_30045 [Labilithrix sp.]|nr:hypothetical protein [Labilithrix sp.]